MDCPRCGSRTEVNETRGLFRDRRCTNTACGLGFTTREQIMSWREDSRFCAKTRALKLDAPSRGARAGGEGGAASAGAAAPQETPNKRRRGRPKLHFHQAGAAP
jgi:hypothetical protein